MSMSMPLIFKNFGVEKLEYLADNSQSNKNFKLRPKLECGVFKSSKDNKKFQVQLGITIGDKKLTNYDFYTYVKILGNFEIRSEIEDDKIEEDTIKEAISILFPYLRSIVSDLTSKGNKKPIVLPPINVNDLMNQVISEGEK